jgi:hypothetical protein
MSRVEVEQKNYQMPPQDGFTIAHFLTEPLRVDRRLFGLSHAALAGSSSMA